MADIQFPINPVLDQIYISDNNNSWKWNGYSWDSQNSYFAPVQPMWTVTTQTGATYTTADGEYVLINAATQTVTLPLATADARVGLKMINSVVTSILIKTSNGSGSKIDGIIRDTTGLGIYNQWDAITLVSDGVDWFIES